MPESLQKRERFKQQSGKLHPEASGHESKLYWQVRRANSGLRNQLTRLLFCRGFRSASMKY